METADRILRNGKIYPVDEQFSQAEAMAVRGNHILYVGSEVGAEAYRDEHTLVTDLQGKTVLPGFIENHVHMNEYGNLVNRLSAYGKSKEQLLSEIRQAVAKLQPGEWFLGAPRAEGYDIRGWENPVLPGTEELDEAAPNNPVALFPAVAAGGTWVNTRMLEALGFNPDDPQVQACRRSREDGTLSGCFTGVVSNVIWRTTSMPHTWEEKIKAYQAAEKALFSFGFTTVVDAANIGEVQEEVERLYAEGLLHIRYFGCLSRYTPGRGGGPQETMGTKAYFEKCPIIGAYGGRYNVRTVKLCTCGTIDNYGAEEYEPYCDRPDTCGTPSQTDEQLWEMVKSSHDHGMQLMCHAIGDKGIDRILNCYQRLHEESPINDLRYRVEHYQLITGDSPERMKAMGVIPSMQAMHGPDSAEVALKRLGPERVKRAYATGLALQRIGIVIGGSDAPAATPRAMSGIHAEVTCTNDHLEPKGGFNPENAISVQDAIRSYTIWGAYSQFAEKERGSLEAGKLADYVILDRDPVQTGENAPDDLLKIQVVETVLEGETVYRAEAQ